jgi:hypothetical protein
MRQRDSAATGRKNVADVAAQSAVQLRCAPLLLASVQISYRHMPGLGGLRHPCPDSSNSGWHNASFRGYADYMQSAEFADNVDSVAQLARALRCVLM